MKIHPTVHASLTKASNRKEIENLHILHAHIVRWK